MFKAKHFLIGLVAILVLNIFCPQIMAKTIQIQSATHTCHTTETKAQHHCSEFESSIQSSEIDTTIAYHDALVSPTIFFGQEVSIFPTHSLTTFVPYKRYWQHIHIRKKE